jgi:hypothetical protein
VNNRPHYLKETLASWGQVRGIGDARLVFRCEPRCPEAVALCEAVTFAERTVTVNRERFGVLANPWHAMEQGFTAGGFTVLAEEDLVVSPDVLEYFTWCQRYRDDLSVLGVTTYQRDARPGGLAGAGPADWSDPDGFHFWVWGTWKDRWERLLRGSWDFLYARKGWDWDIRDRLVTGAGMTMIAPSLARSQHMGRHGGTHCTPAQHDAVLSRCYAGGGVPPQEYREVP